MTSTKLWKVLSSLKNSLLKKSKFKGSADYWIRRYQTGGNSGAGSYDKSAEFKARIINDFVAKNKINTVIEFGCGDGNQLKYSQYKAYTGFDISPQALELCRQIYAGDKSKAFKLVDDYIGEKADLTLSLDVIFHLVEKQVYFAYMKRLFDAASRYVIIYSSNTDDSRGFAPHVRHHKFTNWVADNCPEFKLIMITKNELKRRDDERTHFYPDFYFFERIC